MTQNIIDTSSDPSGVALMDTIIAGLKMNLYTSNSGIARPVEVQAGMLWINNTTNPWVINFFDGTNDVPFFTLNTSTHLITFVGLLGASGVTFNNTGTALTSVSVNDAIVEVFDYFLKAKGTSIASAATTNIGAANSDFVSVTGTTAITSLGSGTNYDHVWVQFDGALTLTHNATSLNLPSGANITTAAGDVAEFVRVSGSNWKCVGYQRASGQPVVASASFTSAFSDKVTNGLVLSNNATDQVNDINVAAGSCVSDDGTTLMTIASAIGKRLDAAWAVGGTPASANGGLDTGTIANTTYHVWVIHRPDTGVTDVLLSTSATSPTMPVGAYTKKKCIGSIVRASGSILLFTQRGNQFMLNTPVLDVSNATPGTSANTGTLASVPSGVAVEALVHAYSSANGTFGYVSALTEADLAPSTSAAPLFNFGSSTTNNAARIPVWTNTSGQFRYRMTANSAMSVATLGWNDPRI